MVSVTMMMIANESMICANERTNKRMSGNLKRSHESIHTQRVRVRGRGKYTHPIKSGNEHQKVDKEIEERDKSSEKLQIAMNV